MASVVKRAGLQMFLHNEALENSRLEDGRLTYPVLLEYLDPDLVKMQFQMSAMRVVGDPVMYFTKYPGRFVSMHLQGVDLNAPLPVPGGPGPGRPRPPQVAVGKDSLDWPKTPPPPRLPREVIERTREKYLEALVRLTGRGLSESA